MIHNENKFSKRERWTCWYPDLLLSYYLISAVDWNFWCGEKMWKLRRDMRNSRSMKIYTVLISPAVLDIFCSSGMREHLCVTLRVDRFGIVVDIWDDFRYHNMYSRKVIFMIWGFCFGHFRFLTLYDVCRIV